VLAINVSGINEEEAGALNGHGVPVKNDYRAEDAGRRRYVIRAETQRIRSGIAPIAARNARLMIPFRSREFPRARTRSN